MRHPQTLKSAVWAARPSTPNTGCVRREPERQASQGDAAAASKWRRKQWRLRRIVAVGALNDPSVLVLLFAYRTDSL